MICDIGDLRPGTPARISAANARAVHRRPTDLAGPCFLRYSLADGTRLWNMSATTPMKQSRPASESRRTSKLSMQTVGVLQGLRLGKQRLFFSQVELCDNLIFFRRAAVDQLAERLHDMNRTIGQPKKITLIFGRKVTRQYKGKLQTELEDLDLPD
jgi:hypothetical protein